MKSARSIAVVIFICFITSVIIPIAQAYNASSTSFFIRQNILPSGTLPGITNANYPYSTSTSFTLFGAAGETAVGTSTSSSFGILSGFLRNIYREPDPTYTQLHYHWRNDDGSETTATSKTSGTQDTDITGLTKLTTVRLRLEITNTGGSQLNYTTQQFRLEYGLKSSTCAAIGTWTDVGAVNGDWDMSDSTNLTEAGNTTNIAVSTGGVSDGSNAFISSNAGVKDTSSQLSAISIPSDSFLEMEFSVKALTAATDGGTYCFRVTNAGSTSSFSYSAYPQATITGGSLTFTLDGGSEAFPAVTPGSISATSSIMTITTSNSTGFVATVIRDDSTGTMSLGSVYIPDKTAWSAPGATTTPGNATASTTEPQTLQFRVRQAGTDTPNYASTWWGTDDTTANARFAGFPSTAQNIINRSTAAGSGTSAVVLYNLDVPVTQRTGTYSGSITYTVTANP